MAQASPQNEPHGLTVAVSPTGQPRLVPLEEADGLPAASRARLEAAFARGFGHGLLHLGAAEPATALPAPLGFARDVGRLFVTRLCGVPELETAREKVAITAPATDIDALVAAAPPMAGGEYVDAAALGGWWDALLAAFREEIREHHGTVQAWLSERAAVWHVVGKICFHLAENRGDPEHPFAFLATYVSSGAQKGKVQHAPLARALERSSGRGDRETLLSLLVPVHRAAEQSKLVAELVDSGDLYQPLAWTPAEAHRFLRDIPAYEAAGVVVRIPDWWRGRRATRPEVTVRIGGKAPAALGADALLDFSVAVTLGGEELSAAELRELAAQSDGLALVRGRWVELDQERLREVLDHWKRVQRSADDGVSFLEGMRLLAGDGPVQDAAAPADAAGWSRVVAGDWLGKTLTALRGPEGLATAMPAGLRAVLRPYQETGVRWLWFAASLRLGVCLADDMGLGKTMQVLAAMLLHKERAAGEARPPHLLVVPASLIANWQAEIERFAPDLRALVVHGARDAPATDGVDLVITTYGTVMRSPWFAARQWSLVVLDEAQAIKNPGAKQTRAVKALPAQCRVALTGTPVENRLGDLWSLFDFLQPGLLGSARAFTGFAKKLAERGDHAPLRRLVQPYLLRRLKTDRSVIADLPDKIELKAFCGLARTQAALYQRAADDLAAELRAAAGGGMKRRGVVLSYLMRFKQICNHPSQWLGDGGWAEADSGKLVRLRELAEDVAAKQEKMLVFTQFRETTGPLAAFLAGVFGQPGLVLHGGTSLPDRRAAVKRFQEDAALPFFVLSLKAGGTGLNLTAASHVVHFDRWWNPAVENQATDRAFRIGQKRNVLVHKLVCRGTIEEKIDALIEAKQGLSRDVVEGGGGEALLTELPDNELMAMVALDLDRARLES